MFVSLPVKHWTCGYVSIKVCIKEFIVTVLPVIVTECFLTITSDVEDLPVNGNHIRLGSGTLT